MGNSLTRGVKKVPRELEGLEGLFFAKSSTLWSELEFEYRYEICQIINATVG
jgi:hypothetical protein